MNPQTEIHKGIEIRYGYDINRDGYRANFILPPQHQTTGGFQKMVTINLQQTARLPGPQHVLGHSEEDVLKQARAVIDDFLNE